MQGEEFIVAIVAIVMITGLIKYWMKNRYEIKRNNHENNNNLEDELTKLGVGAQLSKIDNLEQRVRVLEKLATDKKKTLADEIDQL